MGQKEQRDLRGRKEEKQKRKKSQLRKRDSREKFSRKIVTQADFLLFLKANFTTKSVFLKDFRLSETYTETELNFHSEIFLKQRLEVIQIGVQRRERVISIWVSSQRFSLHLSRPLGLISKNAGWIEVTLLCLQFLVKFPFQLQDLVNLYRDLRSSDFVYSWL